MSNPARPQVVIIGAGFGGLAAARSLARAALDVTVLDRNNYHTFFPLLYQVAAAELEPQDIVYPVRSILHRQQNARFLMSEIKEIDLETRIVKTADREIPYDILVLAAGSAPHFFGVEGAAEYAFQLKSLEDAIALRNHILFQFEQAVSENDPQVRRRMLSFAIVGGGPTGVEYAGALAELIRGPLHRNYPTLNPAEIRVLLLESADNLLGTFPAHLGAYAVRRLRRMGVEVSLGTPVSRIAPDGVTLKDGEIIPLETVAWTAGVRGAPINAQIPFLRNGQVKVLPTLQVEGHPEVYVLGDLASFDENGHPLPMLAPVAQQQGAAAARNILRQMSGQETLPFHYFNKGTMATIGRNAAVARVAGLDFSGFPAWLLWLTIHLYTLIGFRNRLLVLINWAWDYLFYERAVSLIAARPFARHKGEA